MLFADWMERMAGVWSFLIIQAEGVVAVVEVMIQSVMNVVNLVTLLVSAARALAKEE